MILTSCTNAKSCCHFSTKHGKSHFSDPGLPLYLTEYIESGDIETGRSLARVTEPLDGLGAEEQVESYAGYFTVKKETDSNMFFWFIPATVSSNNGPRNLTLKRHVLF